LRIIIGCYLGVEASQLRFCYGQYGKPALAETFGKGRLYFNMSRSEGLALYAFTREGEVGVDIERIRDIPEIEPMTERYFSDKEKKVFYGLPEYMKRKAFFLYWTRKESVLKALGSGLYYPLNLFDVSSSESEPVEFLSSDSLPKLISKWYIQDLSPGNGFTAACAAERLNRVRWYFNPV